MVVLFALWTFGLAQAAPVFMDADPKLTAKACEATLHTVDTATVATGVGPELCTWLTGSHALLNEAVDSCTNVRELFALFYLQRAFTMPPRIRHARPSVAQKHFEEVVSFSDGQALAGLRARAEVGADEYAAELVQNLALFLTALADPAHEVPHVLTSDHLNIYLDVIVRGGPASGKRVHALFAQSFTEDRRAEIRRLAAALNVPAVRAHVYRFVKTHLGTLIDTSDRTLSAMSGVTAPAAVKAEIRRSVAALHRLFLRDVEAFLDQTPPPTSPDAINTDLGLVAAHLRRIKIHVAKLKDVVQLREAYDLVDRLRQRLRVYALFADATTLADDLHLEIAERMDRATRRPDQAAGAFALSHR